MRPKRFYNRRAEQTDNYRQTPHYPSADTKGAASTYKTDAPQYTGSYVKGVATMHKSNAVPVTDGEYAKDIARMRRN